MHLFAVIGCLAAPGELDFLADHDPVWELAPVRWLDGIPLANGHIGAQVWGDGKPLKLTLDRYDAWETRGRVLGEGDITYQQLRQYVAEGNQQKAVDALDRELHDGRDGSVPYPTRLPMPRLEIDFGPQFEWGMARLHLRHAGLSLEGRVAGKPVRATFVTHATRNALVILLEGFPTPPPLAVGLNHLDDKAKAILANWGYPDPTINATDTAGTLRLAAPTGYEYAIAWERRAADNGAELICLSLLSNEDAPTPLDAAQALTADTLDAGGALPEHESWWGAYWRRSCLALPDARFESLYFIEMYKLGCLSRPGGYPITLQGLWTLDGGMPPWSGDYHFDMNVQQTYWPIYAANRLELGEPLYRVFSACIPFWREQCRRFFGCDGIWSGASVGPRGERIYGYSGVQLWPGNAAWLTHHYWLHYLYSQDKDFLRDQALPIMRLAFMTYSGILEEGDDGRLHVPLSNSPEYGEGGFDAFRSDPTCDIFLIRWLGSAILAGNAALGADDELTPRINEVLEKLIDYPRDGNRLLISPGQPLAHSHRHHSHLMGIHPLGILTRDGSEADQALINASLRDIRVKGTGEWTGWAFPWMALIAARAEYGNNAWQMLDIYANSFIRPNTFHINGDPRIFGLSQFDYEPMTLEAGFGAAAALMEMMLQSYGGTIRVFPAMPDRWNNAYFADFRAEGAFVVTSKMQDGAVRFVRIRSEAGGPCTLLNPFGDRAELARLERPGSDAQELTGDVLQFNTEPDGAYLLFPVGKRPKQDEMGPPRFERLPRERNFYGLKRHARY